MAIVNFRTDAEVEAALADLGASTDNRDRSRVVREAILLAAREARRQRLLEEATALANDPQDRAAVAEAQADMEALRAW
jgi:hypothetical protein